MLSLLYVILSGIALPVGGIQMQYLWRNQLGDVYSLGLGSAACLGAAAATMSGWCSLTVGSFICTLICTLICYFVTLKVNTQHLITFGILFGTFIGSLGTKTHRPLQGRDGALGQFQSPPAAFDYVPGNQLGEYMRTHRIHLPGST